MIDGARVRSGGTRTPNGTVGSDAAGATTIIIPANAATTAAARAAVGSRLLLSGRESEAGRGGHAVRRDCLGNMPTMRPAHWHAAERVKPLPLKGDQQCQQPSG